MQETNKSKVRSRKEYEQSFIFAFGVLITGMLLEWITGGTGTGLPSWPVNVQIGLSFIIILVFVHLYYRELIIVKWISRVPAALSAITLFSLLVLVLGLTPQNMPGSPGILHYTGLSHIRNSFPFLLSGLYLLTSLGLTVLRRLSPLSFRNIGFLLNHAGLWIIVFAGSLGAGDLQRLNINVREGETVWYGVNERQHMKELPFTLRLKDFNIEQYNPKLAYIRTEDLSIQKDIMNNMVQIEEGMVVDISGWKTEVEKFLPDAHKDSSGFYPSGDKMAFPAAFLKATAIMNGEEKQGWISCGNAMNKPEFLNLDENYSLAMTVPEPKTYSSLIEVITKSGKVINHDLQVNKSLKVSGWDLYQLSYDERMGKWSEVSVIEAVRDPWLILIYTGIFMLLAGAAYMFWLGKN